MARTSVSLSRVLYSSNTGMVQTSMVRSLLRAHRKRNFNDQLMSALAISWKRPVDADLVMDNMYGHFPLR